MCRNCLLVLAAFFAAAVPAAMAGDDAREGKCLIFNLRDMKDGETQKLLDLVPLMTLGGTLINAGSASHPILCFEYDDDEQAREARAQLADVYDAKDVATAAQLAKSCDDYGD